MMTYDEAKTFLLQLNTDKQLNASEHEAIRVAVRVLEDVTTSSDTCHACYKAGQIVFGHRLRKAINICNDDFYITKTAIINYIDEELDKVEEED